MSGGFLVLCINKGMVKNAEPKVAENFFKFESGFMAEVTRQVYKYLYALDIENLKATFLKLNAPVPLSAHREH